MRRLGTHCECRSASSPDASSLGGCAPGRQRLLVAALDQVRAFGGCRGRPDEISRAALRRARGGPKQTAAASGFSLLLRSLWRLLSIELGRPPFVRGGGRLSIGATGFEPAASCSRSKRSTKLSYAPSCDLMGRSVAATSVWIGLVGRRVFGNRRQGRVERVGGEGFEPPKAMPADLQSAPVGHLGIRPEDSRRMRCGPEPRGSGRIAVLSPPEGGLPEGNRGV